MRSANRKHDLPDIEWLRDRVKYDPETGLFETLLSDLGSVGHERDADGYVVLSVGKVGNTARLEQAHRVAFVMMLGRWPEGMVDHINHDRSDNRWSNLRECTAAENVVRSYQKSRYVNTPLAQERRRRYRTGELVLDPVSPIRWVEHSQVFEIALRDVDGKLLRRYVPTSCCAVAELQAMLELLEQKSGIVRMTREESELRPASDARAQVDRYRMTCRERWFFEEQNQLRYAKPAVFEKHVGLKPGECVPAYPPGWKGRRK